MVVCHVVLVIPYFGEENLRAWERERSPKRPRQPTTPPPTARMVEEVDVLPSVPDDPAAEEAIVAELHLQDFSRNASNRCGMPLSS